MSCYIFRLACLGGGGGGGTAYWLFDLTSRTKQGETNIISLQVVPGTPSWMDLGYAKRALGQAATGHSLALNPPPPPDTQLHGRQSGATGFRLDPFKPLPLYTP